MNSIKMIQGTDDQEAEGAQEEGTGGQAAWLVNLGKKVKAYYDMMPGELKDLKRQESSLKNPLFRFLDRECSVLVKLLNTIKTDFAQVLEVCEGERKSTNHLKSVATALHADVIPGHWKKYIVPVTMNASDWIQDFIKRVD
jgi:dynein heavy chain 1